MRVFLDNCWSGSMVDGRGIVIQDVKTCAIRGGIVIQNGKDGILIDNLCEDILLDGVTVTGNSKANPGNFHGIVVISGAQNIRIINCRSGPTVNTTDGITKDDTQGFGCVVSGPGTTHYEIINNDFRGNLSNQLVDSGGYGGMRRVLNNIGHNPVGQEGITPGISPYTYTAGASPEDIYIRGGSVSDIKVMGATVFVSTDKMVHLEPGQSMTITYSSAPTMTKVIH